MHTTHCVLCLEWFVVKRIIRVINLSILLPVRSPIHEVIELRLLVFLGHILNLLLREIVCRSKTEEKYEKAD
jgi:hypothetical protein